ncbi:MAG: lipocalin family protein [Planctomycetota bacterium]|jgi:apolipoprotein D and lipocalin family protein
MARTVLFSLTALAACKTDSTLRSVPELDLNRYLRTWHEIAKYPVSFERGMTDVTATYSLREDGKIRVENAGYRDGKRKSAKARAWVPDPKRPAELKVSFFWPFRANYWVIALDPNYQWAIVGEPKRRYLWILARNPTMSDALYRKLIEEILRLGFDPERVEKTIVTRT